ncbi:hypothetical protein LPB142_10150 [Rhodobacter xanthinilyticus]|uniref:Heme A synthase n=1 Tax=Rhodobacter xanthinilyticus TaxID=1850250 RepID=A0A1D9MCP0_9RHOB|nr:COX15/CtaA family protein [Rhodobacter xanthinilyticus]AOZ69634.1 hypothetical protein LPB142_10150 [Rhodobacter xanthinilyticus]
MGQKRSIFEEVGAESRPQAPRGGMIDAGPKGGRGAVRLWLAALVALIGAMLLLGGAARLLDPALAGAGLELGWFAPVPGAEGAPGAVLPWLAASAGRGALLGWVLGVLGFGLTGRLPKGRGWAIAGIGLTLAGAGGMGGWLPGLSGVSAAVATGSSVLGGFAALGMAAGSWLRLARPEAALLQARRLGERRLAGLATGVMHLSLVQILLGGMLAGLDAGRSFTDWPLMGGALWPAGALDGALWENTALIQFAHRGLGYLVVILALVAALKGRRSAHPVTQTAFLWLGALAILQAALGIASVVHAAPLSFGLAHGVGAILLWLATIRARILARLPIVQSIRGGAK